MRPELEDFLHHLRHHARDHGERLALRGATQRYSYAQLLEAVEQRAAHLAAQPGGAFALALDNGPEALIWDLAALFSERPCLILPPFLSPSQRAHCLMQSQASLALAKPGMENELRSNGFSRGETFWYRPAVVDAGLPLGTAKITYTSGSTGTPKGVCLDAGALLRVARELEAASRLAEPSRYLAVLPLAVLLENLGAYAALCAGAALTLLPTEQLGLSGSSSVNWKRLLGAIALSGTQSLILVPQLLLGLVTAIERGAIRPGPLKFIAVGGTRVATSLLQRAAAVGLPVFEGYGLSECASVVCLNRPGAVRPGSVGRPLPHVQVKLADDGEVMVSGSALLGYLGEPPHLGQWWPTGDLGRFDEDGYLYLAGRKKNQFVTRFGHNVSPEWIEAELTQNGVVLQAFVHGEGLHQNLALLWPVDPACTDQALERAVRQSNERLPDYARVHRWTRLPEPFSSASGLLTANGRPRRAAILEQYRETLSEMVSE